MSQTKIGSWEIHTRGFGSKILKKYGWKKEKYIGKYSDGVIAPLFEVNGKFDKKAVKNPWELEKLLLDTDDEAETKKDHLSVFKTGVFLPWVI